MHRVHTENLTKPEKRQLWDQIIQEYLKSGQSVRAYSEAHGLRQDSLSYYVHAYKKSQRNQNNFIPLKLTTGLSQGELRVEFGSFRIHIPVQTPAPNLQAIFQSLKSLC